MDHLSERWVHEAERLHHRYLIEVVEALGLCPWAERARRDDRTRVHVLLDEGDREDDPAAILNAWAAEERVEIGFLLFPRLTIGRTDFDRFVARIRNVYANSHRTELVPFALAAFHPDAEPDLEDAERLIPFLRRTPDRCIQVVRMTALDRVRGRAPQGTQFVDVATLDIQSSQNTAPPLRERIARANLETVLRLGIEEVQSRIESIQRDRAETYVALSLAQASGM
jgi:hypothetical protein